MIDAHQGVLPLTAEEASQRMKEAWTRENDSRIVAWNAQLEQDRVDQEEQDRVAQQEEDVQHTQLEKEAEEQRREAEKKKPKLNTFDPNRRINKWVEPRPAPYALNKINALEYIELDYFTLRGCREASFDTSKSISHDTLAFTQLEDTIAIRPMAALRPSKNIRNDEDLSWEEMLDAKNTMLHFMAKSGVWPVTHAESLAAFFVALELHPRKIQPNGKRALIVYQSRARREWFNALKRDEGFNIELIEEDLLQSLAEDVNDRICDIEIDHKVCALLIPHHKLTLTISTSLFAPHETPLFPCCLLCRHATCCLLFPTCHLPFAIHHLPFAICHLPFAICYTLPFRPPCTTSTATEHLFPHLPSATCLCYIMHCHPPFPANAIATPALLPLHQHDKILPLHQIRKAQAAFESSVTCTPSRRHRDWGHESHGCAHSPLSPHTPLRKHPRSRSLRSGHGSPADHPEKRSREGSRHAVTIRTRLTSFFS